jgi:hypothetical protein
VCGEAPLKVFERLCDGWGQGFSAHAIKNLYYGGDVNVTGLIVAEDLLAQLPQDLSDTLVVLPEVMFNFDHLTLDGVSLEAIETEICGRGGAVRLSVTSPFDLVSCVSAYLGC